MRISLLILSFLWMAGIAVLAQPQGTAMRSTNGMGFGVTTVGGRLLATNVASTNHIAGTLNVRSNIASSLGAFYGNGVGLTNLSALSNYIANLNGIGTNTTFRGPVNATNITPTAGDSVSVNFTSGNLAILSPTANGGNVSIGTTDYTLGRVVNDSQKTFSILGDGTTDNARGFIQLGTARPQVSIVSGGTRVGTWDSIITTQPTLTGVIATIDHMADGSGGASGFGGMQRFYVKADNSSTWREYMTTRHTGFTGLGTATPVNLLDIAGSVVIGSAYAGVVVAPTNGLLVEGNIKVGNSTSIGGDPTFRGNIIIDDIDITSSDENGGLEFKSDNFGFGYGWKLTAIEPDAVAYGVNAMPLVFASRVNSATWSDKLVIQGGGNVGIGTITPATTLDVVGASGYGIALNQRTDAAAFSGLLYFKSSAQTYAVRNNNGNLAFSFGAVLGDSAGTTGISMDSAGNVGVGINVSPGMRLDVVQTNASAARFSGWDSVGGNDTANGSILLGTTASSQGSLHHNGVAGSLYFDNTWDNDTATINFRTKTAGTAVNAMTILGSGKVGIGTIAPDELLHIKKSSGANILKIESSDSTAGLYFYGTKASDAVVGQFAAFNSGDSIGAINFNRDGANDAGNMTFFTQETGGGNAEKMRLTSTGNVGINNVAPAARLDVTGDIRASTTIYATGNVASISGVFHGNGVGLTNLPYILYTNGSGTNTTFYGPLIVADYIYATNTLRTNTIDGLIQQGGRAHSANSAAFGINTKARASAAFVTGIGSDSVAAGSLVGGRSNVLGSGAAYSLVAGSDNNVQGLNNFAVGANNQIQGLNNAAIGSGILSDSYAHDCIGIGVGIAFVNGTGEGTSNTIAISAGTNILTVTRSNAFVVLAPTGSYFSGGPVSPDSGILWQGGAQLTNIYTATATLDFGNVATIGCADLTMTVTGATPGDVVDLGYPNTVVVANSSYSAWVSAADTVTVRFCALISGDPASGEFRAEVHKWK